MATADSKACTKCGCVKPFAEFYKTCRNKDGHHAQCKTCIEKRSKELRDAKRPPKIPKSTTSKLCAICKVEKLFSEFGARTDRGYYQAYCKPCSSERSKLRPKKGRRDGPPITPAFRVCPRCKDNLPKSCFGKDNHRTNGLAVYCLNCQQARSREWCEKNPEKKLTHDKAYRAANLERYAVNNRAYVARNAAELDAYHRKYRQENAGRIAAHNIGRIRGEKRATPAWANLHEINRIYAEAKGLEARDGVKRHVDHVVPIKHNLVCGLHVEHNLQILTASENVRKKNKFEIQ